MRALFGDLGLARRVAQEEFRRCAEAGGRALYLSAGGSQLGWLGAACWGAKDGVPDGALVGSFLDISEVPAIVALSSPRLAVIDPVNRQGLLQGYAHARRLGVALFELDSCLRASGGEALLICESYSDLRGGGERVRYLSQLRRFCGDFAEFKTP